FPERTLAAMMSLFVIASSRSRSRGPEFPIQVVQPNPTRLKPRRSRYGCRPVFCKYSLTTREPGASEVFTQGLTLRPFSTAFFASSPAASITAGFEVLVQEVIAAITTSPCARSTVALRVERDSLPTRLGVGRLFIISVSVSVLVFFALPSGTVSADCPPPPGRR